MSGEQRESDGPADRLWGIATWVVALLAVAVVVGLVIFFVRWGLGDAFGF
jgi:hypothetical protein